MGSDGRQHYADLNQGGSSKAYGFRKGSAVVYLGYKNTRNKEALHDKPYGGATLLDYFLRPAEDVTGENISALYPLAAALSAGQKGALETVTLTDLAQFALSGDGYEQMSGAINETLGDAETISVYAGVDRTVFSGGTALTKDALRKDPEAALSFWGWSDK